MEVVVAGAIREAATEVRAARGPTPEVEILVAEVMATSKSPGMRKLNLEVLVKLGIYFLKVGY